MENMASLVSDTKLAINSMSMSIRMNGQILLFSNSTGKLGKRNSECSYQKSNLRPADY